MQNNQSWQRYIPARPANVRKEQRTAKNYAVPNTAALTLHVQEGDKLQQQAPVLSTSAFAAR